MIEEAVKSIGQQLVRVSIEQIILLIIIIILTKTITKEPKYKDDGTIGIMSLFTLILGTIFILNLPKLGELIYLVCQ